jgi:hypothetical protein
VRKPRCGTWTGHPPRSGPRAGRRRRVGLAHLGEALGAHTPGASTQPRWPAPGVPLALNQAPELERAVVPQEHAWPLPAGQYDICHPDQDPLHDGQQRAVLVASAFCARFARFEEWLLLSACMRARRAAGPSLKCARLATRPAARPAIMARRMTVISVARKRRRDHPSRRPCRPPPLIARDCSRSGPRSSFLAWQAYPSCLPALFLAPGREGAVPGLLPVLPRASRRVQDRAVQARRPG